MKQQRMFYRWVSVCVKETFQVTVQYMRLSAEDHFALLSSRESLGEFPVHPSIHGATSPTLRLTC